MTSVRARLTRERPDFPWLDAGDPARLRRFLVARRWIAADEPIVAHANAGEGNMNLTLRVTTAARSFVVKQARPWVERYDHLAAPAERIAFEHRFYERVAAIDPVASRMPRVLGWDEAAGVLLLEDLGSAADCTGLYAGGRLDGEELTALVGYLGALHRATHGAPDPRFANRAMRALNHRHVYEIPLEGALDVERYEPGLGAAAEVLRRDHAYRRALADTGRRYLDDGACLLHGDYFPGSWLRTAAGIRVIDPEFCFYGDAELDVACAVAHLVLAGCEPDARRVLVAYQPNPAGRSAGGESAARRGVGAPPQPVARRDDRGDGADPSVLDAAVLARYAAAEIMRRILGVAQLPIPPTTGRRAALLARSRAAMLDGSPEALFA